MRPHDSYRIRHFRCEGGHSFSDLAWGLADPLPCRECDKPTYESGPDPTGKSAFVHGDECDVWIRHAICNEDGSPRHFTSKEAMRRAAYEAGWNQGTDTPHPNPRIVEQRAREKEERRSRAQ